MTGFVGEGSGGGREGEGEPRAGDSMDPCMKKWLSRVPENKDAIERTEEKIKAERERR